MQDQRKREQKASFDAVYGEGYGDDLEHGMHRPRGRRSSRDCSSPFESRSTTPSSDASHKRKDHDKRVEELRQQNKEAMQEKTLKAKMDGAALANDAEAVVVNAGGLLDVKSSREEAWGLIEDVLGVDRKTLSKLSKAEGARGIPKLAFLAIVVGCELDLCGFAMAFKDYWDLDVPVVQILLVLAPCGYLIAVLMYMYYAAEKKNEKKVSDAPKRPGTYNDLVPPRLNPNATSLPKPSRTSREPILLKYYHFLPLFRYYLIIKDQEPEDVEGLFRVNSLSSFTLGTAQMVGIAFQQLSGKEMTLFVQINILSLAVNWLITFLYFGTSAAQKMKNSTKIDALIYNNDLEMKKQYESYLEMVRLCSNDPSPENQAVLSNYERMVEKEISEFTKMPVERLQLTQNFNMMQKTTIRKHLRRKLIKEYENI